LRRKPSVLERRERKQKRREEKREPKFRRGGIVGEDGGEGVIRDNCYPEKLREQCSAGRG